MPRFFIPHIEGNSIAISGDDAQHIVRSLRMAVGDGLILCDGKGYDYQCVIREVGKKTVLAEVVEKSRNQSEPNIRITLFQALPKGDKLDFIVQKATELGASEIVPVLTSRCISRPDAKSMEKKCQRLARTALEAAKQSGRGVVPVIGTCLSYSQALLRMKESQTAILLYEGATAPLSGLLGGLQDSISVFVGSEGGLSRQEAEMAEAQGIACASLGPRILRCETAPLCVLSTILYAAGQL